MIRADTPTDPDLAAYFAGHLSASRTAEIAAWIASDRINASRAEAVRLLLTTPTKTAEWNRDRIWSDLQGAIERSESESKTAVAIPETPPPIEAPPVQVRSRFVAGLGRFLRTPEKMVTVAAVVIGVGVGVYVQMSGNMPQIRLTVPTPPALDEYVTNRGDHVTVQLSDGTRVTLAPESRLRVATGFGEHDRTVELEGEAEFDVVHDPARPFRVQAGRALVVDIGTRFDVRLYANDRSARVAVAEGAVTLGTYDSVARAGREGRSEGVLIRKGEVGRLDALGHAVTAPIGTEATYFGWTEGRLVFEREPLRDVVSTIARWYDVEVNVPDAAVANRLVTAEFSTQSPSDMIRALARAVNASVARSGGTYTLTAR